MIAAELFARPWIFIRGVPAMKFLPPEGPPEIAFAGRSNVGKSSLINALVGQKGLARTSNTPGRTQELNYFVPDGYSGEAGDLPPMALVDMPGYGYAQAPKDQVDDWTKLVFDYLKGRVDAEARLRADRRPPRHQAKNDEEVLALLDKAAVSYQLVLTKTDKIKPAGVPQADRGDACQDQEAAGGLSGRSGDLVGEGRGPRGIARGDRARRQWRLGQFQEKCVAVFHSELRQQVSASPPAQSSGGFLLRQAFRCRRPSGTWRRPT